MKKFLVPTDFSENANNALYYALNLASEVDASIMLLHVIEMELDVLDVPLPSGSAYQVKKEAAELAIKAQLDLATGINAEWSNILDKAQTKVVVGNPVALIQSVADELTVDLIIMGARGKHKSTLAKILGTRSSTIAQQSRYPVLIIPANITFKPIVQLAYASELLVSDPFELWKALDLIKPFSPIVRYLHISQQPGEYEEVEMKKMGRFIETQSPALQLIFYHIYAQDIDKELEEFSRNFDVDMMVIFHKSKNLFQRLFTHSHTKHLISMTDKPLLVLHDLSVT